MSPSALAEAQRILDRAAARILRARLDGHPAVTPSGSDDGAIDDNADQVALLGEGEEIPVVGANGHRRQNGSL